MHHYTYWLTCVETNESYIGVRTAKVQPELDHYWSSSKVVKAMMANGKTFTKQLLAEWDSREEANSHEILLHEIFDVSSNPKFLNKANHLSSGFCVQGNKEVGNKIAKALKGRKVSEATRQKMSAAKQGSLNNMYGTSRTLSEEARAKISSANKGRKFPPEFGQKISAALTGKKRGKYNLQNKSQKEN